MDIQANVRDRARPATIPENIFLFIPNLVGKFMSDIEVAFEF